MMKIEPINNQDLSATPRSYTELRIDIQLIANKINEIIGVLNTFYTPDPEYLKSKSVYYLEDEKPIGKT